MDHFCNSLFLKMDLKKLRKKIVFVDFQKFYKKMYNNIFLKIFENFFLFNYIKKNLSIF